MPDQVTCGNCGAILPDEDGSIPPERRVPCPVCGSVVRAFVMHAESGIYLVAGVEATLERVFASTGLLLQAVVSFGEKTAHGRLITAVMVPWFEIIELLKRDPAIAHKIPPGKWEEIIAGAYQRAGFDEVTLTPRSRDRGRDVIAAKKEGGVLIGTVRIIDQVKAYAPGHLVTADDVRALMGVLYGEPATKGVLTTTSDFAPELMTDPIIAPFVPHRIQLVNGTELLKRLTDLSNPPPPGAAPPGG